MRSHVGIKVNDDTHIAGGQAIFLPFRDKTPTSSKLRNIKKYY